MPQREIDFNLESHRMRQKSKIILVILISAIVVGFFLSIYITVDEKMPGQQGKNLKGLVTIDRKKKKAFKVLKEFYSRWGRQITDQ